MADPMVNLWLNIATKFKYLVLEYLGYKDIPEKHRTLFEMIPGVMDSLLYQTANPKIYTRDNLVLLVQCWNDFYMSARGNPRYREFPEWPFMIIQFEIFVNEFEMKEVRAKEKEYIQDMETKMTTTTSSIQDLQGRVKELERPWYSRSGKKKAGSGSGERMVDLLEDLEKLSCSEKGEKD